MTSAVSFVFVPGMSSVGSVVYAPLLESLTALGYNADTFHVLDNPSVVPDLTKAPQFNGNALQKDIEQIRAVLQKLVTEQNRDVVLVGHSYGGTPAIYGASGLWKHQREAAGQAGGVIKIALIASSLTLPGGSVAGDRAEWQKANNQPGDEGSQIEVVEGVSVSLSMSCHAAR
jgi:pimeloyl-ACP methyl ester carboxylesterase